MADAWGISYMGVCSDLKYSIVMNPGVGMINLQVIFENKQSFDKHIQCGS